LDLYILVALCHCHLIRRPLTVRNVGDYQNFEEGGVSADAVPPPPTALSVAKNHIEQDQGYSMAVPVAPPSLPTSPVRVPAPTANMSSPTDSYDSSTFGKVCAHVFCATLKV